MTETGKKKSKASKPESYTRFAAIDFETADQGRDSACAAAIVVVEKGKIVRKAHALIRPPRREFVFSYIHGITWEDVAEKPRFGELWPEIRTLLREVDFIAAHNASFDRSVLHACCASAGVKPPEVKFLCTVKLARRLWDIRPTKLPNVCSRLGIPLNHHNAKSDALACAKIVIEGLPKGLPKDAFLPIRKL
jgi:DNA polymerase-3 subunit epsilon